MITLNNQLRQLAVNKLNAINDVVIDNFYGKVDQKNYQETSLKAYLAMRNNTGNQEILKQSELNEQFLTEFLSDIDMLVFYMKGSKR